VDPRGLAVDREPIRHVDRVPVERVAKPVSVVWFDDSEPVSLRQRVGVETRLTRGLDGKLSGRRPVVDTRLPADGPSAASHLPHTLL